MITFYTLLDRIRPSPHVESLCENLLQTSFYCTDNSFQFVHVILQCTCVYVAPQSGGRQQSSVYGSKRGSYYLNWTLEESECNFV